MDISVVLWVLLLTVGVAALGTGMAYGISKNRSRSGTRKN